jgi:hypothetical protein
VTTQTAERLTETLDAALVDPGAAQLLRSGQLTSALRHVGFGVVDENGDPAPLAPIRPRVVRHSRPADGGSKQTAGSRHARQNSRSSAVDRTLAQRRAAQQTRTDQADADFAAADDARIRAEQNLDAHQHRISDLKADLVRFNEQLEQTRETLRTAEKQTRRLQHEFDRAKRNAAAVAKRRDLEQRRLTALDT